VLKQLEQIAVIGNSVPEVSHQLLNALEYLESADREFQSRCRRAEEPVKPECLRALRPPESL